jgi:hypothetical protein
MSLLYREIRQQKAVLLVMQKNLHQKNRVDGEDNFTLASYQINILEVFMKS